MLKPAAAIAAPVSRDVWQLPAISGQTVASRTRCTPRIPAPSAWTCSKNRSVPPGRRTLRISASVALWSTTEHSTRQATAASKDSPGKGSASARPSTTSTATGADRAAVSAMPRRSGSGSTATTRSTVAG